MDHHLDMVDSTLGLQLLRHEYSLKKILSQLSLKVLPNKIELKYLLMNFLAIRDTAKWDSPIFKDLLYRIKRLRHFSIFSLLTIHSDMSNVDLRQDIILSIHKFLFLLVVT